MFNPELNEGDRVVLIKMGEDPNPISPMTRGTVKKVVRIGDLKHYEVSWDDKRTLSLIPEVDKWVKEEDYDRLRRKKINESMGDFVKKYPDLAPFIAKNFSIPKIMNFLNLLRESGITNMFGSAPYLYMGRKGIEKEIDYRNLDIDDYEELLEKADEVKDIMVSGTIRYMDSKNEEFDMGRLNSYVKRFSQLLFLIYVEIH